MAEKRDVLLGMAKAGTNVAKAPLLINNNWAKIMNEEYSSVTSSSCSDDVLPGLAELKRLQRAHSKAKRD
jgi:hypothetical protein